MNVRPICMTFSVFASLVVGATAQSTLDRFAPSDVRIPIHTHADDPQYGRYGTWAAGANYKASFHDGFAFYPYLGPDYARNLPLIWRTEAITLGETVVTTRAAQAVHRHSDWRYEIRYPGVIEAYDIRPDGVEQTFALDSHPAEGGDWIVTGRIETELSAAPRAAAVQAIEFTDAAGKPLVRYGAAMVIDARGDKLPVTSSFDGQRIRLVVPGAWLAQAQFPVLLDPLTTAVQFLSAPTLGAVRELELGTTGSALTDRIMVVLTRQFTATDSDAFGYLTTASFNTTHLVFSDITSVLSSDKTCVAFCESAARWAIGFQRSTSSNSVSSVRLWVHDRDSTTPAGGAMVFIPQTSLGSTDRNPDVGGGSPDVVLVVYQNDITQNNSNTLNTEVYGVTVRPSTLAFSAPFLLANQAVGTRYDRENPTVNQRNVGSTSWLTAWQDIDRNAAVPRWEIAAQRIRTSGTRSAFAMLTPGASSSLHRVAPAIDGSGGRYIASYLLTSLSTASNGAEIRTTRFDAADSSSSIDILVHRVTRSSTSLLFSNLQMAFDSSTNSHWATTYQSRSTVSPGALPAANVVRVGPSGGVLESITMLTSSVADAFHPAITFSSPNPGSFNNAFTVAYTDPSAIGHPLFSRRFIYDPNATVGLFGTACGTAFPSSNVPPRAGTENFAIELNGAPSFTPAFLLLSTLPGNTALDSFGMTNCVLNLDLGLLLSFPLSTNGGGFATLAFDLPDSPVVLGDVFMQWLYRNVGANPANLQATRGMSVRVR